MLNIDAKNHNYDGLRRWIHYISTVTMYPALLVGLTKQSDGTTDANGLYYPTNLNNYANLGQISTFQSYFASIGGLTAETEMYTNNQTKQFVCMDFFKKYSRLIYGKFITAVYPKQLLSSSAIGSIDSSAGPFCSVKVDSTRTVFFYKRAGTGLYAICLQRSGTTITAGTAVQLTSANNPIRRDEVDCVLINTDKLFLVYNDPSRARGAVLTLSGTTITVGVPVDISNGATTSATNSVCKLDTDKVITVTQETTTLYARACTVSGSTITAGSATSVGTTRELPYIQADSTTTAFLISKNSSGSGSKGRVLSVSGTTITPASESDVNTGGYVNNRFHFFRAASNKMIAITTDDKAVVISISGTAFSNTNNSISGIVTSYGTTENGGICEISAGSSYNLYQGESTSIYVRRLTISGTTVTAGTAENMWTDTDSNNIRYLSNSPIYCIWDTDILILTRNSDSSYISAYLAAVSDVTYELYNDATIMGSAYTDTHSFVEKTRTIDQTINAKKLYLGVKNTSGATRYIKSNGILVEVK